MREYRAKSREDMKLWLGGISGGRIYYQSYDGGVVASHWILPSFDKYVAFRLRGPELKNALPLRVVDTPEEAHELCEKDIDWLAVRIPGAESDRETLTRQMQAAGD